MLTDLGTQFNSEVFHNINKALEIPLNHASASGLNAMLSLRGLTLH